MLTYTKYLLLFLIAAAVIFFLLPKNDNSTDNKNTSLPYANAVDSVVASNNNTLFVGIVSSNGLLFPIASQRGDSSWSNPWTSMWSNYPPMNVNTDVPDVWFRYFLGATGSDTLIKTIDKREAEFACVYNYALVIDERSEQRVGNVSFGPEIGVAFSEQVKVLSEQEIFAFESRLQNAKKSLDLLGNNIEGESKSVYEEILFFHWQGSVIGILLHRGYESMEYVVIQIGADTEYELLRISGGGC